MEEITNRNGSPDHYTHSERMLQVSGNSVIKEVVYSSMNELKPPWICSLTSDSWFTFVKHLVFHLKLKDVFSKQNCIICRLLTVLQLELNSHFFPTINKLQSFKKKETYQTFKNMSWGTGNIRWVTNYAQGRQDYYSVKLVYQSSGPLPQLRTLPLGMLETEFSDLFQWSLFPLYERLCLLNFFWSKKL